MESPQLTDQFIVDEITAITNSLGKLDENDGTYMKDRDCKACLKELLRYLGSDNKQHATRCALGSMNIIKNDLIPLINQYCDYHEGDPELFTIILRLSTNLTTSILLLFEKENEDAEPEPENLATKNKLMANLFAYKEAFADDEKIWSTLNLYLRHENEDEVTFERLVILIRNILHIPVDSRLELGMSHGLNAHDICLYRMDRSGMMNTLIKLASETQKGSEYCFHIMEIVYLMLRDQNPRTIAQVQSSKVGKKLDKDDPDKKRLAELSERNRRQRAALVHRSSRIPGSYVVQNKRSLSENPLITHNCKKKYIKLDVGKQEVRKAKNKKPIMCMDSMFISDKISKISKASYGLKLFCKQFVEKVFNNYMQQIKHNLIQKKAQDDDETYYLWAMQFFIPFVCTLKLKVECISETLSTSTLHFIQILISGYQDKLKIERKNFLNISLRLHMALRSYREILRLVKSSSHGSDFEAVAKTIKKNIFSELEYSTLLLTLFQQYNEPKHSLHYISDLIDTNHLFLEIMDDYTRRDSNEEVPQDKIPQADIFMTRYCHPDVLIVYAKTLRNYKTNEDSTNLSILRFFERIVRNCKNRLILTQASLMRSLLDIVATKQLSPETQEGYAQLTKELVENFATAVNKKRWMYQELLFWKTNNDVSEIENQIDPPPVVIEEPSVERELNYDASQPEEPTAEDAEVADAFEALQAFEPSQAQSPVDLAQLLASSPSSSGSPIPFDLPSPSEPPSPAGGGGGGSDDGIDDEPSQPLLNPPTASPQASQPLDPLEPLESLETLLTDI